MRHAALALVLVTMLASPAAARVQTKPLKFSAGASSATVSGALVRGDEDQWTVGARKGQQLTASVSALEQNAVITIYKPGWKKDADGHPTGATVKVEATRWSGALPASGDYLISVDGTRGNASYKLTVAIK